MDYYNWYHRVFDETIYYGPFLPAADFYAFLQKAWEFHNGEKLPEDQFKAEGRVYHFRHMIECAEVYKKIADGPLPLLNYRIIGRWTRGGINGTSRHHEYQELSESRVTPSLFTFHHNNQKITYAL